MGRPVNGGVRGGERDPQFLQPFCSGWKVVEMDLNGVVEDGKAGGREARAQGPRDFHPPGSPENVGEKYPSEK